jgi:hypothetical protein
MASFISKPVKPLFEGDSPVRSRRKLVGFIWEGETYRVAEIMRRWREKSPPRWRRHGKRARTRWHVSTFGRDYFRVRTCDDRVFELYYDRKLNYGELDGDWILWRELTGDEIKW